MLGTESQSDEPRGDAAKQREPIEQPHCERRLHRRAALERPEDDVILQEDLHPLRDARRQLAPPLDGVQLRGRRRAVLKRAVKKVRRGDGILDREIDSHAADR